MMTEYELENYLEKHKVSEAGRDYVRLTRDSDPSRLVGEYAISNVCTGFPSTKMGWTIQAESSTGELAYVIECEYDTKVIEIWDQIPPVSVNRTYKNGSVRAGSYTADYLVLTEDGPLIVEIKLKDSLQKLVKKKPKDWECTENGYIYRPAHETFSNLSLKYQVKNASEINPIRTANLKLLLSARDTPPESQTPIKGAIQKALSTNAWMRLSDLCDQVGIIDHTPILKFIDDGLLHCSLEDELLSQPESAWIATTAELITLSREIRSKESIPFFGFDSNKKVEIIHAPTKLQADRALNILEKIKNGESGRSIRRWKRKVKEGEKKGLSPFSSVLPQSHLQGNRSLRINPVCINLLEKFIKKYYANPKRLRPKKAYALYKKVAERVHPEHPPISRPTFNKYIQFYNQTEIALGRGGKRAANASAEPSPVDTRELKATLPFELGSLDHYLLDQECFLFTIHGKTYTARPWLTVLIDVFSGAVLASWLSFRQPSTRACAMVIRQCVRKHSRLPSRIIVDRGAEFTSVYFSALMAHYGIMLSLRPASHPRYGSEVERFFEAYKTQWLGFQHGNLVDYVESRSVSSSHTARNTAALTIKETLLDLQQYIEWRNGSLIGVRPCSSIELLNTGIQKYSCIGRSVEENEEFIIQTAVDVRSYTIDRSRGIHIDDLHYWDPSLSYLASRRRPAEVRLEPEDPYRVYALVKGEWATCYANGETQFKAKSSLEQLAESIRILDGRSARDAAKEYSEGVLIEQQLDKEENRTPQDQEPNLYLDSPSQAKITTNSIFAEINELAANPLTSSKWRIAQ